MNNQDVVGNKCVKDKSGNLSINNKVKKVAWKQHYEVFWMKSYLRIPRIWLLTLLLALLYS